MDADTQAKIDALANTVAMLVEKIDASSASTQSLLQAVIFGAVMLALVFFLVRQQAQTGSAQQFNQDNTRQQMTVTQSAANELGLFRAMQTSALETQVAGTKALTALSEAVGIAASAVTAMGVGIAANKKSLETVAAGQTTLNATTMTVSEKISDSLKYMSRLELGVKEFIGGLRDQGFDIWKLAENEVRPTDKTREDVAEIANNPPDAPELVAPAAAPIPAAVPPQPGDEIKVTGTVTGTMTGTVAPAEVTPA